ncbi:MAG: IS1/IS1595 family N-terminal zinc-binding domain-containing protein [Candidatus Bathyarchaeales archaeon]
MKHVNPRIVNCPHCGRILPREIWDENSKMNRTIVKCPRCGSSRIWKDAKSYTAKGVAQRYYCRDCGRRFSAQ